MPNETAHWSSHAFDTNLTRIKAFQTPKSPLHRHFYDYVQVTRLPHPNNLRSHPKDSGGRRSAPHVEQRLVDKRGHLFHHIQARPDKGVAVNLGNEGQRKAGSTPLEEILAHEIALDPTLRSCPVFTHRARPRLMGDLCLIKLQLHSSISFLENQRLRRSLICNTNLLRVLVGVECSRLSTIIL